MGHVTISDQHLLKAYMGELKEDIKHDLFLKPEDVMKAIQYSCHIQGVEHSNGQIPPHFVQ